MNRDRMRGNGGKDSAFVSLNVLYAVLLDLVVLMAPLTPFITEHIYQNLKRVLTHAEDQNPEISVHFRMMPEPDLALLADGEMIIRTVSHMQQVVLLGRKIREQRGVNLKTPVQSVTVLSSDPLLLRDIAEMEQYICEELNALEVKTSNNVVGIETWVKPNFAALKSRFADDGTTDLGALIKALTEALKNISTTQIAQLAVPGGQICFESVLEGSVSFSAHDVLISRDVSKLSKSDANLEYGSNAGNAVVVMDFTPREDLIQMALAREVSNKVQKLRKNIGLNMKDNIVVYLGSEDEHTQSVLALRHEYIESIVKKPVVVLESHAAPSLDDSDEVANTVEDLNEAKLRIIIRRRH